MNFEVAYQSLCRLSVFLETEFKYKHSEIAIEKANFPANRLIGDWSDRDNLGMPVKQQGSGGKNGLYFITKEDGEILYLGKATKGNLHERVWGHLNTPEVHDENTQWNHFPKNNFKNRDFDEGLVDLVFRGRAMIKIILIEPAEIVSLAEVFLHTHVLPPLNKQIG